MQSPREFPESMACTPPSFRCSRTHCSDQAVFPVLGPDSPLAACHSSGRTAALGRRSGARSETVASLMAVVSGLVCILIGAVAPGIRHRAAVEADPLRLHEWHRADGTDQSTAEAVRVHDRKRRPMRESVEIGESVSAGKPTGPRSRSVRAHWRRSCCSSHSSEFPAFCSRWSARRGGGDTRTGSERRVKVLGPLPQGLPSFALPSIALADPARWSSAVAPWRWSRSPNQRAVAHQRRQDPQPC